MTGSGGAWGPTAALVGIPTAVVGLAVALIPGHFGPARIDWWGRSPPDVPLHTSTSEAVVEDEPEPAPVDALPEPSAPASRGFSPVRERETPESEAPGAGTDESPSTDGGAQEPPLAPPLGTSHLTASLAAATRVTVWPSSWRKRSLTVAEAEPVSAPPPPPESTPSPAPPSVVYVPVGIPIPVGEGPSQEMPEMPEMSEAIEVAEPALGEE